MKKLSLILVLFITINSYSQELKRRASWQATFKKVKNGPGMVITDIEMNSPLDNAEVRAGDILLQVNGDPILSSENWTSITYALRSQENTTLLIRRSEMVISKTLNFKPLGKESHENLDTYYETVTSDYGITQRVIITKPKNVSGKQPAIFLVQGLSCSTIEKHEGRTGNWPQHITDIVEKSGMVVIRVDKPGVGDSEGDCAETDFITELEGYKATIRLLKSKDYVDTTKIVLYGSSMGSALGPLLANEFNLAGVISDGTFFKTWYEHMLEIERRIRQMSGDDESTIRKKMNEAYIPLYYGMLIQKKSYSEIIKEYPAIANLNYHPDQHMYGRPLSYYHQLQNLDLAGEWEKLQVPLRILYGSNDWIMSEFDNYMIMKALDRVGHKDHELKIYPGLDHWNTIHEKPDDSFLGKPGKWDPKVPELIIDWAKEMVK